MKLSILIPVHNEAAFITKVMDAVFALSTQGEKEIIVINDGSTDKTSEILENLRETHNFKLLTHPINLGKGAAIKTGLSEATGDLLLIQDADLEYSVSDIPLLLDRMRSDVWAVYGVRESKSEPNRGYSYVLGARILSFAINYLFNSNLRDVYTGYKLFNLANVDIQMLKDLKSEGFEFEAEVTCKLLKENARILETPISYSPRSKSEGKHIRPWDAVVGLYTIFKCRFR